MKMMQILPLMLVLIVWGIPQETLTRNLNPIQCEKQRAPCFKNMCDCTSKCVICVGNGRNLTTIPDLRPSTELLNFSSNYLESISRKTLCNITHIRVLVLTNNSIRSISSDAFQDLTVLKVLFLDYNDVPDVTLQKAFHSLQWNFRSLSLSYNKMGLNITKQFIKGLTGPNITDLFIEGNNIKTLEFSAFHHLKALQTLSTKDNDIYKTRGVVPERITSLSLQWNRLSVFPRLCSGSGDSSLEDLDLRGNNIGHLRRQSLVCLINLWYFGLVGNRLITIKSGTFSSLPQLKVLSLSDLFKDKGYAETVGVEPYAFNNSGIKAVYLASIAQYGYFDVIVNPDAFKGCTGLQTLSLSYNAMLYLNNTYLNALLCNLHTLQVIKMSRCQLSFFHEVLSTLAELRTIDLHGNRIMRLKQGLFNNLKKLQNLRLSENAIEVIHETIFPVNLRIQLKRVNLAYNNFVCTCANLWFIKWMKSDKKIFDYFPDKYVCGYPTELQSKRLIDANISEQTCQISPFMFPIIFDLSIAAIVLLVIISLTYRWRWHIRYCVYMLRFRQRQRNVEREEAFIYDAFVLYCEDDSVWIRNNLLPKLETDGNLKLCIHERDFTPGCYIVDNIVKSLENSRNIVLLLSDNFSQSPWCLFELTLVLKRSLEQGEGYVVVVLLEEIHARSMTSSLYALLQTTTYITWPVEEEDRELFWMRLRCCLQR